MQTGDSGNETQTQTVARHASASLQPVKSLEDVLMLVFGNSRSIVGNAQDPMIIVTLDLDEHPPPLSAVLDRIVHEVRQCVEQEVPVSCDEAGLFIRNRETHMLDLRRCIKQFDDVPGDFRQIDRAKSSRSACRFHL